MFEQLPGWTFAATHPIALNSHRFGARAHWLIVEREIKLRLLFFPLHLLSPRLIERSSEWVWFNSRWFKTSLTLTLSSPAYIYLSAFPAHSFCLFLRGIVGGNPRQCHVSVEASRMHTCGLALFFFFSRSALSLRKPLIHQGSSVWCASRKRTGILNTGPSIAPCSLV